MSRATLTGLMPVNHYHEAHLHAAVDSMSAQADPNWRLLVITERSGRRELKKLIEGRGVDQRVEVIVNSGRGLAGAFNTGMRQADTDFVAILLGDDTWSPDAVAVLRASIAGSPETDFFHTSRRIVDEAGRPISSVHRSRGQISLADFRTGTSPVKHLLCWRRDLGLAIGGMDESLNSVGVDDFDFPWSMAEQGARFTAIAECLYLYRDHRDCFRLTTHLPLRHHKRELASIMRKHGVDGPAIRSTIARAERSYLQQCLYDTRIDRWLKGLRRHDPRCGWRDRYS